MTHNVPWEATWGGDIHPPAVRQHAPKCWLSESECTAEHHEPHDIWQGPGDRYVPCHHTCNNNQNGEVT